MAVLGGSSDSHIRMFKRFFSIFLKVVFQIFIFLKVKFKFTEKFLFLKLIKFVCSIQIRLKQLRFQKLFVAPGSWRELWRRLIQHHSGFQYHGFTDTKHLQHEVTVLNHCVASNSSKLLNYAKPYRNYKRFL